MKTLLQRELPQGWEALKNPLYDNAYESKRGLHVIESLLPRNQFGDGKVWYHLSCSYRDHLPDWSDLEMLKRVFIGHEQTAYQVLPPVSKYVNIHKYCLHLWCCMDGAVTPDFTTMVGGVRHI